VKENVGRRPVVAGVCYRRRDAAVEFLLVRTKRGDKWTFPKGHVEQGEAPPEAVAREAREEGGVTGVVEQHPLTRYVYPSGSDRGGERPVDAYLLEVSSWTAPAGAEGRRDPAWFSPEDAKERLAEGGREPRYAEEHGRVVDAALAQITGAGQRSS